MDTTVLEAAAEDDPRTDFEISDVSVTIEVQSGKRYLDIRVVDKDETGITFVLNEREGAEVFVPYENLEFVRTNYTVSTEVEVASEEKVEQEEREEVGSEERPWDQETIEEKMTDHDISPLEGEDLDDIDLKGLEEPEMFVPMFKLAIGKESPDAFTTTEIREYIKYVNDPAVINAAMEVDDRKTTEAIYGDRLEEL